MPKYTVTDPETNKSIDLEGDSPPTEQELNDIFSQVHGSSQSQPEQSNYSQGLFKTYEGQPRGLLPNADVMAGTVANKGMEAIQAPFEMAGEAMRGAGDYLMGQKTDFNAPKLFGGQGGQDPFGYANKVARTAVAGISAPLRGQSMLQQAKAEYNRPQSNIDTMADVSTGLASTFLAPRLSNAPMEAATEGVSKLMEGTGKLGSFFGKKALRSAFGPSEEALSMRYNEPKKILSAKPNQDLGQELANDLNNINKQISDETDRAWKSLLKLKAEPRDKVVNFLKSQKRELNIKGGGPLGSENQKASREIDNFIAGIPKEKGIGKGLAQHLDQEQLKQIIMAADNQANWANSEPTATEKAFRAIRGKINQYLRDENPNGYAEIMDPIAKKLEMVDNLSTSFGMQKSVGKGGKLEPRDVTAGKFPLFLDEKRSRTREYLSQLKQLIGKDYLDEARTTKLANEFEGSRPAGSRRTLAGTMIGAGADLIVPGAHGTFPVIGALMGALADTYGGKMAGAIVDGLRKSNPHIISTLKNNEDVMALVDTIKKSSPAAIQARNVPTLINKDKSILQPKTLDEQKALEYLDKSGNDPQKALELMKADGY